MRLVEHRVAKLIQVMNLTGGYFLVKRSVEPIKNKIGGS